MRRGAMRLRSFEVLLFRFIAIVLISVGTIGVCGTVADLFELAGGAREYVADSDDSEEAKRELVWEGLRRGLGFVSVVFVIVGVLMLLASVKELRNKGL
jgi:hypothetical protein